MPRRSHLTPKGQYRKKKKKRLHQAFGPEEFDFFGELAGVLDEEFTHRQGWKLCCLASISIALEVFCVLSLFNWGLCYVEPYLFLATVQFCFNPGIDW